MNLPHLCRYCSHFIETEDRPGRARYLCTNKELIQPGGVYGDQQCTIPGPDFGCMFWEPFASSEAVESHTEKTPGVATQAPEGLSRRDYFAAAALQGCLAHSLNDPRCGNYHSNCSEFEAAIAAYRYADAMLKAAEE